MTSGPCLACDAGVVVERVPYPERNRIERPDGVPVFLCDDCRSAAEAGEYGAFSNGSLLHLREWAPLFGIDVAAGAPHDTAPVSGRH